MTRPTHIAAAIVEEMCAIRARAAEADTAHDFDAWLAEHDELVAKFYHLPAHEREAALR